MSYYILGNKYQSCNKLGWGTKYKSINKKDLELTATKVSKYHNYDVNKENIKLNLNQSINLLENIIKWCKTKNIKVMLLTPPAFETYRKKINKEQLNIMFNKSLMLSKTHENCTYINLFDSEKFNSKDFYDSDHLSEIGAEKLSKLLNEYMYKKKIV